MEKGELILGKFAGWKIRRPLRTGAHGAGRAASGQVEDAGRLLVGADAAHGAASPLAEKWMGSRLKGGQLEQVQLLDAWGPKAKFLIFVGRFMRA